MKQDKTKSLPTNIEYQFLLMAQRVMLQRDSNVLGIYKLGMSIFSNKDSLGLNLTEGFIPNLMQKRSIFSDDLVADNVHKGDPHTIQQIKQKSAEVYRAIIERINEVKKAQEKKPDLELKKTDIETNIELLADAAQMTDVQKQLLLFYACAPIGNFQEVINAAQGDTYITPATYAENLAVLLDVKDHEALARELEPDNILTGVNFLAYNSETKNYSIDKPLQRILMKSYKSKDDFLTSLLGPAPRTELQESNYEYMHDDFDDMYKTLRGYLDDGSKTSRKNMTIGGPPGTGKTQVTAVLAKKLGAKAFLVGVAQKSDKSGFTLDEPSREERIKELVRSAFIMRRTGIKGILVVDEAEDILRDLNRETTKETGSKAFINELLETLGVPTIFISNRTDLFDPATTRRILPYFGMNYMPFEARISAIIEKTKKYIGTDLTRDDVSRLSEFATDLPVAIIDTCINIVSTRTPDKNNKQEVLKEIEREFLRALKAQNGGIPPLPINHIGESQFNLDLVSANKSEVKSIREAIAKNPASFAGCDVTIVGDSNTGRKSLAQNLAAACGKQPRVLHLDSQFLAKYPDNAYALELERSALDGIPIVFHDATKFLINSKGHPFLERIKHHPLPTFFVCDVPRGADAGEMREFEKSLSHLTFVLRTGNLKQEQLKIACKEFLDVELTNTELQNLSEMTIGDIATVKTQMEALGKLGDKEATLIRLAAFETRMQDVDAKIGIGFVNSLNKKEPSLVRAT